MKMMKKNRSPEDRLVLKPFRDQWSAVPTCGVRLAFVSMFCLGAAVACFVIEIWTGTNVLPWIGVALVLLSLGIGRVIQRREKPLLDELTDFLNHEGSLADDEE